MGYRRLLHWGPITALTIIVVLFCPSILTILIWHPPDNGHGIVHLFIFFIWVFNILKNFFKAAFLGPGHIPFKWKPEREEDKELVQFCEPCQGYKAPRAHHCKKCKQCIMKMDHHCPWINNCIGHYNHKSFTLFLLFVVFGCFHAAVLMICCIVDHLIWVKGHMLLKVNKDGYIMMSHYLLLFIFFGVGLSIGVTLAVGFLLYYQLKSIIKNETGIESWVIEKAEFRSRHDGDVFVYPYDLGVWENTCQVLTWSHDYIGNGIYWPVFEGCDQYTLTIEQLEQKDLKRDRMIIYKVEKPFNGAWFPIRFGCKVCYDTPWTEEIRLSLKVGDIIHATRFRKHWLYGEKSLLKSNGNCDAIPLGEVRSIKGWLPRCCVKEVVENGITILGEKKVQ